MTGKALLTVGVLSTSGSELPPVEDLSLRILKGLKLAGTANN